MIAYLIGSLSFAVIVSRLFGLADPRSYGSGNPGATNVLRSGNKAAAILTLVFDALKGYIPVAIAVQMGLDVTVVTAIGLGAFLGHLWPVFFKFEGGKGVATAAGVLLGFAGGLGGYRRSGKDPAVCGGRDGASSHDDAGRNRSVARASGADGAARAARRTRAGRAARAGGCRWCAGAGRAARAGGC